MRRLIIMALAATVPTAVAAAIPSALQQVATGQWEISGAPGAKEPVRMCVSDILALAQFEHRGRKCTRNILSDKAASVLVRYSCGGADFGQSQIDVVTPRALSISTQGISNQLPFNYVIQAHRVGDCAAGPSSPHH